MGLYIWTSTVTINISSKYRYTFRQIILLTSHCSIKNSWWASKHTKWGHEKKRKFKVWFISSLFKQVFHISDYFLLIICVWYHLSVIIAIVNVICCNVFPVAVNTTHLTLMLSDTLTGRFDHLPPVLCILFPYLCSHTCKNTFPYVHIQDNMLFPVFVLSIFYVFHGVEGGHGGEMGNHLF